MAEGTTEKHFEEHIVRYLTKVAQPEFPEFVQHHASAFDKDLCLIPEDLIGFIQDTQPEKYKAIQEQLGADADAKIAYYASQSIKTLQHKTLSYFRTKLKITGQHLDTVYFKPQHSKSPEHALWYQKNRLTIVRQLKYSKKNENSVDIVLFVNGIPVITIELKNALTSQYLLHAIKQYIEDRDPKETLFEFKRCLVHFAVSTEQVSMCTELKR
jgi:type I restriction enzyme R subunit